MKLDVSSLAHTKWECKYHIVFAPKYRRQVIYGKIKQDIGQMLRKLCEYKGIEIHEAEAKEKAAKRKRARRDFDFPPDLLEPTRKTASVFLDFSRVI